MRVTIVGKGQVGQSDRKRFGEAHAVTMTEVDDPRFHAALALADVIVLAHPIGFDATTHCYDTGSYKALLSEMRLASPDAVIVLRLPVPLGFCDALADQMGERNIVMAPAVVAGRDILGGKASACARVVDLLGPEGAGREPEFCSAHEAEAMALSLETYLATRQAFVNEVDSFALTAGLDAAEILRTLADMPRLGLQECSAQLGARGQGLPKSPAQLRANSAGLPEGLMRAVLDANAVRARTIARNLADAARAERVESASPHPPQVGVLARELAPGSQITRVAEYLAMDGVEIELLPNEIKRRVSPLGPFDRFLIGSGIVGSGGAGKDPSHTARPLATSGPRH